VPGTENEKQGQGNHRDGPNCLAADAEVRELHSVSEEKTTVAQMSRQVRARMAPIQCKNVGTLLAAL
jgi:hypothetical protein